MNKTNSVKEQVYNQLITYNLDPEMLDSKGKSTSVTSDADVFSFDYTTNGNNYGTVVVTFAEDQSLEVYFGDNLGRSMEEADRQDWYDFLYMIRMIAKRNLLTFGLKNLSRLKYTMQSMAALKESIFEGYYGNKKVSYSDKPQKTRLVINHNRTLGENDARFRYIESLFVETADGEKFKLPFTKLAGGRAMAQHVSEGGRPYDPFGQHITKLVDDINVLSRFARASQNKTFEGAANQLVADASKHYVSLKKKLKHLASRKGYHTYKEAWAPMEGDEQDYDVDGIKRLFVEQNIDARIESALPLLSMLQSQEKTGDPDSSSQIKSRNKRDIASYNFDDAEEVDVNAIHLEEFRKFLLSKPSLFEGTHEFKSVRKFLNSFKTETPDVGSEYVYASVQATPPMNYFNIAHFESAHQLVKLDENYAYFDINGKLRKFPETSNTTGDVLSEVYFFNSEEQFARYKTMLTLQFGESTLVYKSLDNVSKKANESVNENRLFVKHLQTEESLIEHAKMFAKNISLDGVPITSKNRHTVVCSTIFAHCKKTLSESTHITSGKQLVKLLAKLDQFPNLRIKVGEKVAIINSQLQGDSAELWGFTTPKTISKIHTDPSDDSITQFEFNNDPDDVWPRTENAEYNGNFLMHSAFFGDKKSADFALITIMLQQSNDLKIRNHVVDSMSEGEVINPKFSAKQAQQNKTQYARSQDVADTIPRFDPISGRNVTTDLFKGHEEEYDYFYPKQVSEYNSDIVGVTKDGQHIQTGTTQTDIAKALADACNRGGFSDQDIRMIPMKEADIFESWANRLLEGTWAIPDTNEKVDRLARFMSNEQPLGPDATNATEELYDLIGDDGLFDMLGNAAESNPDADAREVVTSWAQSKQDEEQNAGSYNWGEILLDLADILKLNNLDSDQETHKGTEMKTNEITREGRVVPRRPSLEPDNLQVPDLSQPYRTSPDRGIVMDPLDRTTIPTNVPGQKYQGTYAQMDMIDKQEQDIAKLNAIPDKQTFSLQYDDEGNMIKDDIDRMKQLSGVKEADEVAPKTQPATNPHARADFEKAYRAAGYQTPGQRYTGSDDTMRMIKDQDKSINDLRSDMAADAAKRFTLKFDATGERKPIPTVVNTGTDKPVDNPHAQSDFEKEYRAAGYQAPNQRYTGSADTMATIKDQDDSINDLRGDMASDASARYTLDYDSDPIPRLVEPTKESADSELSRMRELSGLSEAGIVPGQQTDPAAAAAQAAANKHISNVQLAVKAGVPGTDAITRGSTNGELVGSREGPGGERVGGKFTSGGSVSTTLATAPGEQPAFRTNTRTAGLPNNEYHTTDPDVAQSIHDQAKDYRDMSNESIARMKQLSGQLTHR